MSPSRRHRLARSALLLVLLLVLTVGGLWLRDRRDATPATAPGPAPAARPAPAADPAKAATRAEGRPEERTWRLRVTTHPPGALLAIRPAGGAARRARTPGPGHRARR
jgi:hypothetical protein